MRSCWKCSFYKNNKKIVNNNIIVSPNFLNKTVFLQNGKSIIKLKIYAYMFGAKFGCFIKTKKSHYGSKSKY